MDKKRFKSILSALLTLLILAGIMALVLRGNVEAIMNSIASISAASLIALLALGVGYQLLDSAMCMTLVRSRVPGLSYRQAFELISGRVRPRHQRRRGDDTDAERVSV